MTTAPTPLRLRPMPLSELLDELFRMYRRNFALVATTALALEIPALLFNFLTGQFRSIGFFFDLFANSANPDRLAAMTPPRSNPVYLVIGYAVLLLLLPISTGLLLRVTTDVAMGRPTNLIGALQRTARRYLSLAAFDLMGGLAGLAVAAVIVMVVVAGVALGSQGQGNALVIVLTVLLAIGLGAAALVGAAWIGVRLLVVVPAMLEEEVGPIAAIRRSWALVRGNFWRMVGIMLIVYVLGQAVRSALSGVLLLLVFVVPGLSGEARGGLLLLALAAVEVLTTPIFAIAVTLLYFD
ncbi:MAG: glycerophosphoryl diester phosphodiesterase membrane domain-containing protein, partial [Candidatus Dormibacteraeota bacterium]|nr:glycerophosphoryl diester phosphodiesterase membrane domain-containing protein [Candidatus Dormibacteraeota bacterium]